MNDPVNIKFHHSTKGCTPKRGIHPHANNRNDIYRFIAREKVWYFLGNYNFLCRTNWKSHQNHAETKLHRQPTCQHVEKWQTDCSRIHWLGWHISQLKHASRKSKLIIRCPLISPRCYVIVELQTPKNDVITKGLIIHHCVYLSCLLNSLMLLG